MKTEILIRKNYFKATELEDKLKPVLRELDVLMPRINELSKVDSRFSEFEPLYLDCFTMLAELIHTLREVTQVDKQQAADRGMRELSNLCHKRIEKIQNEISSARFMFVINRDNYAAAVNNLVINGHTPAQIERVMETTPKPDDQAFYLEIIEPLEREHAALVAFTKDFPRYDQSVLIGTEFENWQPEKVVDFDEAARLFAA